ncbi:MAG: DUF4153 domain-containing protein, partial [Bacilli bacterium]|nr:DUF4153 domain-containing protein [Bacilli bacterium]
PLSAPNVSKLSQEYRLKKILVDNNMLVDNKIIKNSNLGTKVENEIVDILLYLAGYHHLDDIEFLQDGFYISDMEEIFGFSNN